MDALAFLGRPNPSLERLYVLHGDEAFLKRQVTRAIRDLAVGPDGDESAVSTFGEKVLFSTVWDELESLPFYSPKRMVVVENADPFVTAHRALLEKKIEGKQLPASGLLVLDVKTWPANTRLAKMVAGASSIVCKTPPTKALAAWSADWAQRQHQKQLPTNAGQLLVELVGDDLGLLDQELLKLAIYVGDRVRITVEDVDLLVGNNRTQNVWRLLDLVGEGNGAEALRVLQRSLEQGEEPFRLVGLLASQLRKLALASRLILGEKMSMGAALAQAGVPPFATRGAEQQLKHLGRRRLLRLFESILELQLDLRGNSPLRAETILERFLLRLAVKLPAVAS